MNDLISRSALLAEYDRQHEGTPGRARQLIEAAPAVDAVEVVRCKECKYYEIHRRPKVLENCERRGRLIPMSPSDYCSYGERRSE